MTAPRAAAGRQHLATERRREGRDRLLDVGVVVALLATVLVALVGDAPRSSDPPSVRAWVTTPDGTQLLAERDDLVVGGESTASLAVAVDPSREYQAIDGFGASITDSSAAVLYRLDPEVRDSTMVRLFDPQRGAGLGYLRQPMGASDFVDEDFYTYDDLPPGETDFNMERFSIEHDEAQILPLLRRARELNPELTIMASPWTAPAWMKSNGSLIGGSLIADPRIYRAYALYFVEFLRAYEEAGVRIDAISVQNEPQHSPPDFPGMVMSADQQAAFIAVLGPTLRAAGLRTAILAYDYNWDYTSPFASAEPGPITGDVYAGRVLSDPAAARWVDGVAFHCYAGSKGVQTAVHRRFPDARIVLSECSGYRGPGETAEATFDRSLRAVARLVVNATRNWAGAVARWNVALDPRGGPHRGGCGNCTGLVTVGPQQDVTWTAEYYALASVSRIVRSGAVRVASTSYPGTGDDGGLITAAFRNRDGSIAVVVHNLMPTPRRFSLHVGDRPVTTSLAGGGLGTYLWPGADAAVGDLARLD